MFETVSAHLSLLAAEHVSFLADIGQEDGTSNGAINTLVAKFTLAVGAVLAGYFAFRIFKIYAKKDGGDGRKKEIIDEMQILGMAEGALAVVGIIIAVAIDLFRGAGS